MAAHRVLVVLFDGVQSLDVTGPLEVFAGANQLDPGRYRISTGSVGGGSVRTSSGLRIAPDAALTQPPDTLIVPGGEGTRPAPPDLLAWLRRHGARPQRVMSVCTGAFLLAEAGGVTAGIDLALALVEEDLGRDAALTIARHLVMFLRRPGGQSQFSAQLAGQVAERAPLRAVQQLIAEHPSADLSVAALAGHANLSPRHFTRAFTAETGSPPGRYVDRVRLETARRLLEDTADGVAEVARASGYRTTEAMRRAFVQALGVGPAEYRRRF